MGKPSKEMLEKSFHVDWCLHFEWLFLPICHTKILSHELFPSGNIHRVKRSIKLKIFIHNHHTRGCSWISAELISYVRKPCASSPSLQNCTINSISQFLPKICSFSNKSQKPLDFSGNHCQGRQRELWWCSVSTGAHFPGYSNTAAAPMPVPMHMDTTP